MLKEEQRQKAKKAKEDLREFLEAHKKMHSGVRWRRASEMFENLPVWDSVPERERKDVFDDVIFYLGKREKEEEKELHSTNRDFMAEVFCNLPNLTHRTTWSEVSLFRLFSDPLFLLSMSD